jgi:hypothetical protein
MLKLKHCQRVAVTLARTEAKLMLMDARSPLVLMKLGFDLRTYYEDLVDDPLPEDLQCLIERLA